MNKLEYSDLVKRKMKKLKKWLTEHYDLNTAKSILSEMMSDADRLKEYEESGTSIAEAYGIETDYWYLFTHQHYLRKGTEVSGTADNPVIVNYKRKKIRGKYYNQSDTYRLNRFKETNKDGSYDLKFVGTKTTSVPYYDKTSKTIKYDTKVTQYTEKNSISNLIKYMDNYKSYSFHKK